jgi:hypothetical protein
MGRTSSARQIGQEFELTLTKDFLNHSNMKSPLILYPAMLALLLTACDEKKVNATEESIEAQNEMSGPVHEQDTDMVKQDGTLLPGALDQVDSVPLPNVVTNKIKGDSILSKEPISQTRQFIEGGKTYYEVKFLSSDGKIKTLIYGEDGAIKSN